MSCNLKIEKSVEPSFSSTSPPQKSSSDLQKRVYKSVSSTLDHLHIVEEVLPELSLKARLHHDPSSIQQALIKWEKDRSNSIPLENETKFTQECGSKHRRQIEIREHIQMPGVNYPKSELVSNNVIYKFLREQIPNFDVNWNELNQKFQKFQKNHEDACSLSFSSEIDEDDFFEERCQFSSQKSSTIDPGYAAKHFLRDKEVKNALLKIRRSIFQAFIRASRDPTLLELSPEIKHLLTFLEEQKRHLIVRSVGEEDSCHIANAGGNVTVPYVIPSLPNLYLALGRVVVSYYSEASLQNRLNGSQNPFTSPQQLSVEVQEMIGEPIESDLEDSEVPISAVLFTNEPMYVGNEPFRIMRLSAAYGNGEGVVGATGIRNDTIFILRSMKHPERLYILENNQLKPMRLSPDIDLKTGKIVLKKRANSEEMAQKPALDHTLLTRLFYLGIAIEKLYNAAMDVELVIKNGIIYPVQARPIIRPDSTPSYFDWKKVKKESQALLEKHQLESILSGKAEAQILTSSKQVLIAQNLTKAEELFEKGTHQLIIVREEELANSHRIVNFSSMGISVMFCEQTWKIEKSLEKIDASHALVTCIQSSQLLLWNKRAQDPEEILSKGYLVHPARLRVSVNSQKPLQADLTGQEQLPQEIKRLLMQISALESHSIALGAAKELKLEILKQLSNRRVLLQAYRKQKNSEDLLQSIDALEAKMRQAFSELKKSLKNSAETERLQPLFHTKVIEVLLSQMPSYSTLGAISFLSLEAQLRNVEKVDCYLKKFAFTPQFDGELLDGKHHWANSPEDKPEERWEDFLTQLEYGYQEGLISSDEKEKFKQMLASLRSMELLPLWFILFFRGQEVDKESAIELMRNFLKSFNSTNQAHLTKHRQHDLEMKMLQEQIQAFSNSSTFDQAFEQLKHLTQTFSGPEWNDQLNRPELLLVEIINCQMMVKIVQLYDNCIKKMKESPHIQDEVKIEYLSNMLDGYFQLLKEWLNRWGMQLLNLQPQEKEAYLTELKERVIQAKSSFNPLQASKFVLQLALLKNHSARFQLWPNSLEDCFTLIHQNLLVLTQALLKSKFENRLHFPNSLHSIVRHAESCGKLMGLQVSFDKISLLYNRPIRTHSALFTIHYDKKRQNCSLEVSFAGVNIGERWNAVAEFVEAYHEFFPLEKPVEVGDYKLKFIIKLTAENSAHAFRVVNRVIGASKAEADCKRALWVSPLP